MTSVIALLLFAWSSVAGRAQYVTVTGTLASASGLPAQNATMTFVPSQLFFIGGTSVIVTEAQCGTDATGAVVGITNPQSPARVATQLVGTLAPGNYYVEFAWYDGAGHVTQVSPETVKQLAGTGELQILPPVGNGPLGAVGMQVYIGTAPGSETLQGITNTPTAQFTQATALVSGASPPNANTTVCKLVANDAGWPTGTGYNVSLVDASGNTLFSYPAMWQFFGVGSTYNLSNGLPYYHGQVTYPIPVLTAPYNHNTQSISSPISLTNYKLFDVLALGIGTSLPAWGVDVEGAGLLGAVNANTGYLLNGAGPLNHVLLGNGSYYVDSATIPYSIVTGGPGNPFYQTVAVNSVALPQELQLNFTSNFTGTDSAGVQSTIDLANTAVTPGTYTNPTVTFDSKGRATAASNGTGLLKSVTFTSCGLNPDGGSVWDCSGTVSWGSTLPAGYKMTCQMGQGSYALNNVSTVTFYVQTKTSTNFTYGMAGDHSGATGFSTAVDCIATN